MASGWDKRHIFQCFPFAASKFHASWMPTPAPREGFCAVVPLHTAVWGYREGCSFGTRLNGK